MTAPVYRPCTHHAYAADLKGVLLKVPCPVVGCPGGAPVLDGRMETGDYAFDVKCPDCKRVTTIDAVIETVLKRREFGGDKLSIALTAKAVDHDCAVEQLTVDGTTGEVLS